MRNVDRSGREDSYSAKAKKVNKREIYQMQRNWVQDTSQLLLTLTYLDPLGMGAEDKLCKQHSSGLSRSLMSG